VTTVLTAYIHYTYAVKGLLRKTSALASAVLQTRYSTQHDTGTLPFREGATGVVYGVSCGSIARYMVMATPFYFHRGLRTYYERV